jgi:hypothetical protein
MQFRLNGERQTEARTLTRVDRTSISFSSEDLEALARLIQAGEVLLRDEQRPPVITQINAAMTRLGISQPSRL